MKIDTEIHDGTPSIVLSEVYSGIGIKTDVGFFGIAQRDGGIEVLLDGETVYPVGPTLRDGVRLPDGSGALVASFPLRKDHWLYAGGRNEPPMPMRTGVGAKRNELADQIRDAARHAIRVSTMNGKEMDFDPDAMVQNMIVGLLGYWTENGRSGSR